MLGRAWDEVADGYEEYFVPRFRPWVDEALQVLLDGELPGGPLVVPCCGPGAEVARLAESYRGRDIVAIDLSARMVDRTRLRCEGQPSVVVRVGDASRLEPFGVESAAAIVSCFGLQQMPAPAEVIEAWAGRLTPGGVLSVVFWPGDSEPHGPFGLCRRLVAQRVEMPNAEWEAELADAARRGGGTVVRDDRVEHSMRHASAEAMWNALVSSGPWRALELRHGEALLRDIRDAFLEQVDEGPVVQRPSARHLVVRRLD